MHHFLLHHVPIHRCVHFSTVWYSGIEDPPGDIRNRILPLLTPLTVIQGRESPLLEARNESYLTNIHNTLCISLDVAFTHNIQCVMWRIHVRTKALKNATTSSGNSDANFDIGSDDRVFARPQYFSELFSYLLKRTHTHMTWEVAPPLTFRQLKGIRFQRLLPPGNDVENAQILRQPKEVFCFVLFCFYFNLVPFLFFRLFSFIFLSFCFVSFLFVYFLLLCSFSFSFLI